MSLVQQFDRYPLTFGPTPIEHLPRLSAALGGKVQIYAKRDDCNSGLALGGNKLRKLEYIVPDSVHVLYKGRIVRSGGRELASELEAKGYDWITNEIDAQADAGGASATEGN